MIKQTSINCLRKTGDVYFSQYAAPTGDIYILGSKSLLMALIFKNSYPGASAINKHFQKGMAESIDKAIHVLNDYFKNCQAGRKAGKIKSVIKTDIKNISLLVTIKRIDLSLDLSCFTPKEITVYRELLKISQGATISYALLANRAGIPGGARFVGNAMAKNNFPILIPCHRVIKSDGSMGNYSGGIDIKKYLIDNEKS